MSVSVRPSPGSAGGLLSRLAIQKYCSISFLEVSGKLSYKNESEAGLRL